MIGRQHHINNSKKFTVFLVVSDIKSVDFFFKPHLKKLAKLYEFKIIANSDQTNYVIDQELDLEVFHVPITRPINLWKDLWALFILIKIFWASSPSLVHTITPKAGFLGMVASSISGVPIRIHSYTGQVWVTKNFQLRFLLKSIDRCISKLSTDILIDSPSQMKFLIQQRIINQKKSKVLGNGSMCGVNTERFKPDDVDRLAFRSELNIGPDDMVILYLGRLNIDKGVIDLINAFSLLSIDNPSVTLFLVGPNEFDLSKVKINPTLLMNKKIFQFGFTNTPERFMRAADLFCLPSYREGFGQSVIEASSCGTPILASRIYGLTDAVIDNKTGWLHEPGNVIDLEKKLSLVLTDKVKLRQAGAQGRDYVKNFYSEELIVNEMLKFYKVRFLSALHIK
jgi:glycosyltransferase involved in cell wall biosynthesis